jgi:hypothetical protein
MDSWLIRISRIQTCSYIALRSSRRFAPAVPASIPDAVPWFWHTAERSKIEIGRQGPLKGILIVGANHGGMQRQ